MNYNTVYESLVDKAKSEGREKTTGVYYELHHIVPRCMGGDNSFCNLVLLTAREHFISHWLLYRIYPENQKLARAFWMMCNVKDKNQDRHIPSSRAYQEARTAYIDLKTGVSPSQEVRRKLSVALTGKTKTAAHKAAIGATLKGRVSPTKGLVRPPRSEEWKRKISEAKKGVPSPFKGIKKTIKEMDKIDKGPTTM
jgi:hypothetical protein